MRAYLLVSLPAQALNNIPVKGLHEAIESVVRKLPEQQSWDEGNSYKNIINNLHLVIQPYKYFNLLKPWLRFLISYQLTFVYWLFQVNCSNESNARRYFKQLKFSNLFIILCIE
jgi:mannosyltransferase OCH1-like enzyme